MTTTPRKIDSKIFIQGVITTLTGLHIGGNSIGMAIGGADSVVVRNPLTNQPYIPGSSLRGKLRSLLERVRGCEDDNPKEGGFWYTSKDGKSTALAGPKADTWLGKLFGVAAENNPEPTRLIVRDAALTEASRRRLESAPNTDMPMTEVKTEVWIDRITSAANPRQIERVPAGAEFAFELVLTLLDDDDIGTYLNLVYEGLRLVEGDTLGGSGSRGYGQVKFTITGVLRRDAEAYRTGDPAKPLAEEHKIPAEFLAAT